VIQEADIQGISTRSVDDLVKAMGCSGVSKSQVSRLCEEIDDKVQAFLTRPIEGDWPYLWIDATYVKARQAGRVVSVAVIIAVGANAEGRREVLGMQVGPSEAEPFWTEFLRSLARRGQLPVPPARDRTEPSAFRDDAAPEVPGYRSDAAVSVEHPFPVKLLRSFGCLTAYNGAENDFPADRNEQALQYELYAPECDVNQSNLKFGDIGFRPSLILASCMFILESIDEMHN
jgi:hypothetical protein